MIVNNGGHKEASINQFLVKGIAKSHYWNNLLLSEEVRGLKDIQERERFSTNKYLQNILRLRFLAPDIVEAILNDKQPKDLTAQKLLAIKSLDWREQKKLLNF